jgi:hypothetical protein
MQKHTLFNSSLTGKSLIQTASRLISRRNRDGTNKQIIKQIKRFLDGVNNACTDQRILLKTFAITAIGDRFPNALEMYLTRCNSLVAEPMTVMPRTFGILGEISHFMSCAEDVESVFLALEQFGLVTISTPQRLTVAKLVKLIFLPELPNAGLASKPVPNIQSIVLDATKNVNQKKKTVGEYLKRVLLNQYTRLKQCAHVEMLNDVLHDVRTILVNVDASHKITVSPEKSIEFNEFMKNIRTSLMKLDKATVESGGIFKMDAPELTDVYDFLEANPMIQDGGRSPFYTPQSVYKDALRDKLYIDTASQIISLHMYAYNEAKIMCNTQLQTQYRVRAALRMLVQVSLFVFHLSCTFAVGYLVGNASRVVCTTFDLTVVFALMFSNLYNHDDYRDIGNSKALKKEFGPMSVLLSIISVFAHLNDVTMARIFWSYQGKEVMFRPCFARILSSTYKGLVSDGKDYYDTEDEFQNIKDSPSFTHSEATEIMTDTCHLFTLRLYNCKFVRASEPLQPDPPFKNPHIIYADHDHRTPDVHKMDSIPKDEDPPMMKEAYHQHVDWTGTPQHPPVQSTELSSARKRLTPVVYDTNSSVGLNIPPPGASVYQLENRSIHPAPSVKESLQLGRLADKSRVGSNSPPVEPTKKRMTPVSKINPPDGSNSPPPKNLKRMTQAWR